MNVEKLETILMNTLDVKNHKLLRDALKKKMVKDPERTKEILVNAIALAGSTEDGVPDRLMELRKQAKEIWTAV